MVKVSYFFTQLFIIIIILIYLIYLQFLFVILFLIFRTTQECTELEETFQLLVNILIKEVSQHNLQVLKESLSCLEEFFLFLRRSSLLHIMNPSNQIKDLFKNIFKLIRHANRGIIDASISLLKVWFENDMNETCTILKLSHGSIFFYMITTSMFNEIYQKVVGDSQLRWFNDLLFMVAQRWCQFYNMNKISNDIFNETIRNEIISSIYNSLPVLLCHKDEKIREASFNILGNLLALDIFWSQLSSQPSSTISPTLTSLNFFSLEITSDISLIENLLSSPSKSFLTTISNEVYWQRNIGKIPLIMNVFICCLKTFIESSIG